MDSCRCRHRLHAREHNLVRLTWEVFFCGATTLGGGPGAAWRSSDNGAHWSLNAGGNVCSNGVYVFGVGDGVYRSTDSGNTGSWKKMTSFTPSILATLDSFVIGSRFGDGVEASTDNGVDWASLSVPSIPHSITFVGTTIFGASGSIIKSTDWGNDWTQITIPRRSVSVLASTDSILLAGTDSGIFISTDLGGSWFNKSDGFGKYLNVSAIGTFHDSVFANALAYDGTGFTAVAPLSALVGTNAVREAPLANDSIEIYPNPTAEMVTIRTGGSQILGISVLNVLGESVFRNAYGIMHEKSVSLDLSKLPSGTYFLEIQTLAGTVLRKVVRQ